MKVIAVPLPPSPPSGVKNAAASDSDTVSTGASTEVEKETVFSSTLSGKESGTCPSTPPRRSIFNSYWQKRSSSISFKDDDNCSEGSGRGVKRSPKLEPSYLGVYSFAPSPLLGSKLPVLSPISSTDSLTPTPARPKSILRRHRSLQPCRVSPADVGPSVSTSVRPRTRSASCTGPQSNTNSQFDGIVPPPLFLDGDPLQGSDSSKASSSRGSSLNRQHSLVHFDPTITVRECVGEGSKDDQESNWFSESELKMFMAETVNLCQCSAVDAVKTYSLPAVKKAYESAHEVGVKKPILSSFPEYRALFADPVLHATDEDAIVHDGSKRFFKTMSREIQSVLIVDNSRMTLKLFRRQILSMFPHVQIDTALSGEDALEKIEFDSKRGGVNYDLIIVEERLQQGVPCEADLTGSELLCLVNKMESSSAFRRNGSKAREAAAGKDTSSRRSLKIGVSVSLGEDCESLRNKGGADVFWSKPTPRPSNGLRNQVVNALLSKRGKSIFVCGC